jgi:membrane protein YdbS with pleckstrin-like domain
MTEGGDGYRDDDADDRGRPEERAPENDEPPEPAAEPIASDGTAGTHVDGDRSARLGPPSDGATPPNKAGENHGDGSEGPTPATSDSPPLGEPTATNVARVRARESNLERGEITAYTTERRMLDPAVRFQWVVWTSLVSVVLGLVAGAILGGLGFDPVFGTAVVGLFVALGIVWVLFRYRAWIYQVREDSLYLERGVVTHVRTIVPYVRIQHVDTSRGPLERALGLSTLVVYTAGSRGADVSVPGLKPGEARDLQQRLKELAIEAEGDDAL